MQSSPYILKTRLFPICFKTTATNCEYMTNPDKFRHSGENLRLSSPNNSFLLSAAAGPGPATRELPLCSSLLAYSGVQMVVRRLQPRSYTGWTANHLHTRDFQDLVTWWLALVIRRFTCRQCQESKTGREDACARIRFLCVPGPR